MNWKNSLFLFGFGLCLGTISSHNMYALAVGIFLMVLVVCLWYFMEVRKVKIISSQQKEGATDIDRRKYKQRYKQCSEARERAALSSEKVRELLLDDKWQKSAQEDLGWGGKAVSEDWWQGMNVECSRCQHTFKLLPEDSERLKFPSQPDAKKGIYVEVVCKNDKCNRRITVFRS